MKDKGIPTILGAILLFVILFIGVWLSTKKTNTSSNASGDCSPQGVQVTNLTNKSVDISFITSSLCSSTININTKIISNYKSKSSTHYFRIDGLLASTQYKYTIILDGHEYNNSSYTFQTAPLPSGGLSSANLAWGKVIISTNQASVNTIVYLNIPGAWPLSALTNSNGQWHISLADSFSDDKKSLFIPAAAGTEDIFVYSTNGQLTQLENDLSKNDPVPDIIVGQGFAPLLGAGPREVLPTSAPNIINTKLSITSPSEGEEIITLRPDIFGTAKSYSTISLGIDSTINGTTTSKTDGSWNWSPNMNLSPGNHVLTVTNGNELLKRNFVIVSSNSSNSPLSFSATPSAQIITPTSLPTSIPTVRSVKVSTKSGVPITGNTSPFYVLILSSLLAVSFSLYFFNKR